MMIATDSSLQKWDICYIFSYFSDKNNVAEGDVGKIGKYRYSVFLEEKNSVFTFVPMSTKIFKGDYLWEFYKKNTGLWGLGSKSASSKILFNNRVFLLGDIDLIDNSKVGRVSDHDIESIEKYGLDDLQNVEDMGASIRFASGNLYEKVPHRNTLDEYLSFLKQKKKIRHFYTEANLFHPEQYREVEEDEKKYLFMKIMRDVDMLDKNQNKKLVKNTLAELYFDPDTKEIIPNKSKFYDYGEKSDTGVTEDSRKEKYYKVTVYDI